MVKGTIFRGKASGQDGAQKISCHYEWISHGEKDHAKENVRWGWG